MTYRKAAPTHVPLTGARQTILEKEWSKGTTAKRIAEILGATTRSAVIGKAHRMKLAPRGSPIRRTPESDAKRATSCRDTQAKWQEKFWGEAWRIAALRRGYSLAKPISIGAIALEIGCSQASVIRKAAELGLAHPNRTSHSARKPRQNVTKLPDRSARLAAQAPKVAPVNLALTIAEIGPRQCRFPTSPHLAPVHFFCGAEVEASPDGTAHVYCAYHHHIATRPLVPLEEHQAEVRAKAAE